MSDNGKIKDTTEMAAAAQSRIASRMVVVTTLTVLCVSLFGLLEMTTVSSGQVLDFYDAVALFGVVVSLIGLLMLYIYGFLSREITKTVEWILRLQSDELVEQKNLAQQAAKMSALGEMMAGLAHEINTPLAGMKLFLNQAITELEVEAPDLKTVNEYLHKSDLTVDRVAKIIKGLRTFSRSGLADPFVPFSAQEAIEDAIIICEERFKKDAVELRWNIPPETITIDCRPFEITQVLISLIGNSCDAVSALEERWIELHVVDCESAIQIRVTDSGWGIPIDKVEKIFQPFYTTKEIGKGTGIGLSISHGIVRGHNGKLFVDTTLNNTSFIIELPKFQIPETSAA